MLGVSLAKTKYPERNAKMNPLITESISINSASERLEFFSNSDGFIFFTGGIGTLSEFAFMWHSLQLEADFDRPVVLVSRAWKRILAEIKHEQMVKYKYYKIIHLCEQVKDVVAIVSNDYSIKYDDPRELFYKEAVLFNLDGTIVESPEEEFIKLCENIGYFFHMPDVIESFREAGGLQGPHEREIPYYVNILEHLGITTRSATEVADYICRGGKKIPDLHCDVTDILHYFKENGFSTGVISSRHPSQLKEILSAHNLYGLFDFVGTLNHTAQKPDTRRFNEALEVSGFPTGGMVYIGGKFQEDYLNARAIDVDSILLDRHLTHIFHDDVFKIRSLKELRYVIRHGKFRGHRA